MFLAIFSETLGLISTEHVDYFNIHSGISQSYTTNRDRNLSKLTKLAVNNRRYDGRTPDSPAALANQVRLANLDVFLIFSLLIW